MFNCYLQPDKKYEPKDRAAAGVLPQVAPRDDAEKDANESSGRTPGRTSEYKSNGEAVLAKATPCASRV
jgi:hypothetical protein